MSTIQIRYTFRFDDGTKEVFDLNLDGDRLEPKDPPAEPLPDWTELEFHQCPNCPLSSVTHPRCPLAVRLAGVVAPFERLVSYDHVVVEVLTRQRAVAQRTTAQKGISSLLGLIIATSGCPNTAAFKPMARFHLPLASPEETAYRSMAMFLLGEYFRQSDGKESALDFKRLEKVYDTLHVVNTALAKRLRATSRSDATVNALVLLDMNTINMSHAIDESLAPIRKYFNAHLGSEDTQ